MTAIRAMIALFLLTTGCAPAEAPAPAPAWPSPSFERFVEEVQPLLLNRCANPSCHGRADRPFALFAQGAHRLQAADVFLDHDLTPAEVQGNYDRARSFARDEGRGPLLLQKPLAEQISGVRHRAGGDIFLTRGDPEYRALADWVGEEPLREEGGPFRDLQAGSNPFGPHDPRFEPQPRRDKPVALAVDTQGSRLFVALQGSVDRPARELAEIDLATRTLVRRHKVGSGPTGVAVHPGGRFLVVANRFSNYLSVLDLKTAQVSRLASDFYMTTPLFSPDGARLYVTNRWRDAVQVFEVEAATKGLRLMAIKTIPAGTNPAALSLSDDARLLFVASPAALTVAVIDTQTLFEVDLDDDPATTDFGAPAGISRLKLGAPALGLATVGGQLFVSTLSQSTHHPPGTEPDAHRYTTPTTGSPNQGFQALQNELAVFRIVRDATLYPTVRYTSDSYCCRDFRDVGPDDARLGHLVPDPALWIVGGALPMAMALARSSDTTVSLLVAYAGSSELQRFSVEQGGGLLAGPIVSTGFDPRAIALHPTHAEAYVANRLGESVSVVDLERFQVVHTIALDDDPPAAFPATDAELGELLYFSGAQFSTDGDQTCNHCHLDRGSIAKAFSMPLLADTRGSRITMDNRGLLDRLPWFLEGAMDVDTTVAVLEEFAHRENFASLASRDASFQDTAEGLIGRRHSFGRAIDTPLDFAGMTRLVGLFLIQEPALLPNPNPATTASVERGRRLFHSPSQGCAACHPGPSFGLTASNNPLAMPLLFGPVITPNRDSSGLNLDLVTAAFLARFPGVKQDQSDLRLKSPALVGLWDRAPMFLHDGRARSLREVLATPHHPALAAGENGYNEADGVSDSHGGTSHLSPAELDDLIQFLNSL
ncbi:MAG: beta-propeller fold lactonase family protein [Bradymonadaceae bacterium]|nr:beta-propeller fold lactonase family protein [Lujinxingiaceae bacterium]